MCLLMVENFALLGRFVRGLGATLHTSENLVLAHDQVLFSVQADLAARVLAEQDPVALLHFQRNQFPVFQALAFSGGHHFTLLRLLFSRVRDEEPANLGLLLFDSFDNDPIIERSNIHILNLLRNLLIVLRRASRLTWPQTS